MDLSEYQELAYSTCTPACYVDKYLDLGYLAEVGELAGKLAKTVRGDIIQREDIMLEIGDIAWFLAVQARLHNHKLSVDHITLYADMDTVFSLYSNLAYSYDLKFKILKNVCEKLGFDFDECLKMNIQKLTSRQERGTIQGNGDNR